MNKAYLILVYVFSPALYFSFYWVAYGQDGLRFAYSNFIAIWPIWLFAWVLLMALIVLYLRSPKWKPIVVYRYRTR